MEPAIDLLPPVRRLWIHKQRWVWFSLLVLMLVSGLSGWWYGKQMRGDLSTNSVSHAKKQVEGLQQEVKRLESQCQVLEGLQARRSTYGPVLKTIEENLPVGAWLAQIEMGSEGGVVVQGFCSSWASLGNMVSLMKNCRELHGVGLKEAGQDLSWSMPAIKFTIVAQIAE